MDYKAPERSTNKLLYVITVEDLAGKDNVKKYVVTGNRLRRTDIDVEITGSEISDAQIKKLLSENNAEVVNKNLVNITFPLHRVFSIQNITFKANKA